MNHPIDLTNKTELNKLISQIERTLEQACRSYEFANDGAIPDGERNFYEARRIRLMDEVEKILSHYGIECQWPGLFPTFHSHGKETHNLRWALVGGLV